MIHKRLLLCGSEKSCILDQEDQSKSNYSITMNNYGRGFFSGRCRRQGKKVLQDFGYVSSGLPSCGVNSVNNGESGKKIQRKGVRKRKRKPLVVDEAMRLLKRSRYLLVRLKLEQNLIDAYSAEGWKGKSREKIKPESELQRARKKILAYKAAIRSVIHQIELQSREGCIAESVMFPDGSVHHEHIFCAKCKSLEAFADNDIILCDGACNRAFHQKCLDPPLEKIPPGDQGWLCRLCECKMEIVESVNAHLGTSFNIECRWEDIFKEAANIDDAENPCIDPAPEWPSDDSDDDDYNPEANVENHVEITNNGANESDDDNVDDDDDGAVSSSDSFCSSDEEDLGSQGPVNDDGHDVFSSRRKKRDVDYKKLYDEMFGKDKKGSEESEEDEDWGPQRQGQRQKKILEYNDSTVDDRTLGKQGRKLLFRIPRKGVEKLRRIFMEDKFPSKSLREDLSTELGFSIDKINQWFKNARYAALKNGKVVQRRPPLVTVEASDAKSTTLIDQLERLFSLSDKVSRFKLLLEDCCEPSPGGPTVVYVPVAELREKMPIS